MNYYLIRGVIVFALVSISGIFFKVSAETIRQPALQTAIKSPVVEADIKLPTVETPLLRQPVIQTPLLRAPVIAEPTVRQPVIKPSYLSTPMIAEPGVRSVPPKGLVFDPNMPTPPDIGTSLGNLIKAYSGKTQSGIRIQLQQSRDKTTTGTSFGEMVKQGLSEDNGKDSGNIKTTTRQRKIAISSRTTGAAIRGASSTDNSEIEGISNSIQTVADQMADLQNKMKVLSDQIRGMSPEQRADAIEALEQMQAKMLGLQNEMEGLEQSLAQAQAEAIDDKDEISPVRSDSTTESSLQDLALQVKQNNDAKADLRELITELKDIINEMPPGEERDALKNQLSNMEDELSTISDFSKMDMMEMQDAQQKLQQVYQTISGIMKNQHDTLKAIINNMR